MPVLSFLQPKILVGIALLAANAMSTAPAP